MTTTPESQSTAEAPCASPGKWRALAQAMPLTALSYVLLWAAFPPLDWGFLAWVALVPWLLAVAAMPRKTVLLSTLILGFALMVAQLHWLRFVTPPGWLGLAFYCALYLAAAAVIVRGLRRLNAPLTVAAPLAFVAIEFARANLLTGFGFLFLSHTQYASLPVIQIAAFTGAYGVTFLIAMANGLLADLWLARSGRWKRTAAPVTATLVALALALGLGFVQVRRIETEQESATSTRRVFVVQGNVPIRLKHSPSTEDHVQQLARHVALSLEAKGRNVDLILWPETMLPAPGNLAFDQQLILRLMGNPEYTAFTRLLVASRRALQQVTRETGAWALAGAETQELDTNRRYNSAILVSPDGELVDRYDKIHRVVFGEYTPLTGVFPFLRALRPAVMGADLSAGRLDRILELPGSDGSARFGATICYEDSVPSLFRRLAAQDADFMVNITNDGWFEGSSELDSHLHLCVFRAVENRIAVARCANTGVSAFLAPSGRIVKRVRDAEGRHRAVEGTLMWDVPLSRKRTFYTRHGDVFAWLCVVATGLCLVVVALRTRKGAVRNNA